MRRERIRDFLIGFLGTAALAAALYAATSGSAPLYVWLSWVAAVEAALVIAALVVRRPYIALGIVASVILPILVMAACVAIIAGHPI